MDTVNDRWLRTHRVAFFSSFSGFPRRPQTRRFAPEQLEDRKLLSNQSVFTVDLTSDTGAGSGDAGDIAYVVGLANQNPNHAGSLIEFSPAVIGTPQTIWLTQQIDLTETAGPVTIEGLGASNLTLNGANILNEGSAYTGVVQVAEGVTASLTGMSISGSESGEASFAAGGGIANHGKLALDGCTVTENSCSADSNEGGGIYNDGTLSISASTVSGNICLSGGLGGGIYNRGTLTVSDSTVEGNESGESGGGI
jgi:hypothetical protein